MPIEGVSRVPTGDAGPLRSVRGRASPKENDRESRSRSPRDVGFQSYQGGFDAFAGTLVIVTAWGTIVQSHALSSQRVQLEAVGVHFDPPASYELVVQAQASSVMTTPT